MRTLVMFLSLPEKSFNITAVVCSAAISRELFYGWVRTGTECRGKQYDRGDLRVSVSIVLNIIPRPLTHSPMN